MKDIMCDNRLMFDEGKRHRSHMFHSSIYGYEIHMHPYTNKVTVNYNYTFEMYGNICPSLMYVRRTFNKISVEFSSMPIKNNHSLLRTNACVFVRMSVFGYDD